MTFVSALAQRAGMKTLTVVRRKDFADEVRQLGADFIVLDCLDLKERVAEVLRGGRLLVLFEGTGYPGQVALLVAALEDGCSVVFLAAVLVRRSCCHWRPHLPRNLSSRVLHSPVESGHAAGPA